MGRNDWKSMGALCFALVLAAAWPLQAAQASIDEACIANNADLKTALNKAQSSPLKIKLQTGTYDLANTVWHNGYLGGVIVRPGSQLIGGYSSACASRNIAYNNTILTDSAGGTPVDGADIMGDLTVEGVTAKVALAFSVGKYSITNPSTIEFLRDAFVNANGTLGIDWEKGGDSDSTLRVVDSLISKSSSFCPLVVEVFFKSPDIQWINNTLIDNPSGYGGCFFNNSSLGGSPAATLYAYNNIFFGTTADVNQYDFYADNDRVVLVDNIIGAGKRGGTPPISETGTKTTDPNLGVDFVPQMPSSAINTGSNAVPGTLPTVDLDGNDRLVGSNVDRGALESIVDFSNVQMVTKHGFDDGSAGTLSAAISNINTGGGTIKFNIGDGGSCPWVITLGDELDISANATINGYSQSGTSVNGLDIGDDANICIIVEAGTGATPPTRGMVVPSTAADGVSVTIRGIAFSGFTTAGVDLQGGSQHSVLGNHFGGNVGGHAMVTNGFDIRLGPATHDNTIGSTGDADRNIVGDATGSGIVVSDGSANNQIINNYVGIGWNTAGSGSFTNRGNGARGLYVAGDHNTLSANLIAFNVQAGIVLDGGGANNNVISGNFIGTTGTANLGNGAAGI